MALSLPYGFGLHLTDRPLPEKPVTLDPKTEAPLESFQFVQGKGTPFVVVIPEEAHITEEAPAFRIVLGGIPGAGPCGVKEFGHNQRILHLLLPANLGEAPEKFLSQKFHIGDN